MKKIALTLAGVGCIAILFTGCERNISANTYNARTIGASMRTYPGVIVSMRQVKIEEGDCLEDNKTGGVMGAVAGGALGSAIGKGSGNTIATATGAIAGAMAGAYAERSLKTQDGFEYTVKLQSGELRTVVQGKDTSLYPGQNVMLIEDPRGRSRLVPAA